MKKIKLILFDIDNTLVYGDSVSEYYKRYSSLLEETLSQCLGVSLEKAQEIANEHRRIYNGMGEKSFQTYNIDDGLWNKTICTIDPAKYVPTFSHVQEILIDLKNSGYILGAISDSPTVQVKKLLKIVAIDEHIFDTFIGWEPGERPPKGGGQQVYKNMISKYGLEPNEILMVGDSIGADIAPAHACGLRVLHVSKNPNGEYPTIRTVEELVTYLNTYEKNTK